MAGGTAGRFVVMVEQLTFSFWKGRTVRFEGEAFGETGSVRQVTTASDGTGPMAPGLMEEVVRRENLVKALKRVRQNKGSPGADGMSVDELPDYLREHWPRIREELFAGEYRPEAVKEVPIPKRGGGRRKLGIPTVLDRFIQQALYQVLSPIYEPTFSAHSYGFRPGRNAHQAVLRAKGYIAEGYGWVVDMDLEKFFDRVNHDILMGRLAKRIEDKRVLRVIRRYLQAGVMVNGVVQERWEGTPQGGPLSPLLSNILLDELDKELERRGHRFCRYADDCNIYVRSERAGQRVMESVSVFLWKRLRLKVNTQKSAVARPQERGFLGFSFTSGKELKIKLSNSANRELKRRIKRITRRSRRVALEQMLKELGVYTRGWLGYFGLIETPTVLRDMDSWIRRRLRCFMMKQWIKSCRTRYKRLVSLGVSSAGARTVAASRRGPWAMSNMHHVKVAMPNRFFAERGFLDLLGQYGMSRKAI
jgi:group II intron reverse transcriptase/maturase